MPDQSRVQSNVRRASPYSTGGGGTVLEHRYGALLLSHLLTADPVTELGDDVTPHEIGFQASAYSAVDDLVLSGRSVDGTQCQVSIGVRRDPSFVASDQASVELIGSYLRVMHDHAQEVDEGRWRLALVVASPNPHVRQLRELAGIARDTLDEKQFRSEVSRAERTNRGVRERLRHFDAVVASAAMGAGAKMNGMPTAELTWRLLGALRMREVRLEGIDETDRTITVGRLRSVVEAGTADAADRLFSRLCELVGRYAPAAATKTANSLRRDLVGFALTERSAEGDDTEDLDTAGPHPPVVRSDYLSQVRRIAPGRLLSREKELSELERFCTDPGFEPYLWLRAQAWAGKSALMSTFVLDPPSGVRVVSFFVTARWAGQADSTAFTEVVLEQALELLGETMPMMLTDATREAHLLGALERTAELCRRRGERLVLVVDGLDEDCGVTTGADAHSIAAILPANPPSGMRVIVAGRPNPPIPTDVPDNHPLRRPSIVRKLTASPHAEVVRQDAERELKRLLRGSTIEKDLLGLLTAAGGGLSEADLAQLTGVPEWEIESLLGAVSGRTFTPRAGRWRSQVAVYVLSHEEIQQQALRFLGETCVAEYRERIHAWADGYRADKWPIGTPEYLLRGYFKLLHVAGDRCRMLKCATDPDRHRRMLDIIGGDSIALAEIAATQEALSDTPTPDLVALGRLAVHRVKLTERNDHIPTYLPVIWAQLGRHSRAEALARSITTPARQVRALASVARHMAEVGDLKRAKTVAEQAERSILAIADSDAEAHAYAVVARAMARTGDAYRAQLLVERAEEAAHSLGDGPQRAQALAAVARAAAAAGDIGHALTLAKSLKRWSERAQALSAVAMEVASSGDWRRGRSIARSVSPQSDRAHALAVVARAADVAGARRAALTIAGQAETLALSIRNPGRRAWILAAVAREAAEAGKSKRAMELLQEAERAGRAVTRTSVRGDALIAIAKVMALSGTPDRAEDLARNFDNPNSRAKALAVVASGLAASGEAHRAEELANEAESTARTVSSVHRVGRDHAVLAQATASIGDLRRAQEIARAISDVPQRDRTLTVVAEAIAQSGDLAWAEDVASSITNAAQRSTALLRIVKAGVTHDNTARAEELASSIKDPDHKGKAAALLLRANGSVGDRVGDRNGADATPLERSQSAQSREPRRSIPDCAESAPPLSSNNAHLQAKDLIDVTRPAADEGDVERARREIESIPVPALRVRALVDLATALAKTGDIQRAGEFIDRAMATVNSLPNVTSRDQTITGIAHQLSVAGSPDRAEPLVRSITNPALRQRALGRVASAVARSGHLARAEQIARTISDGPRRAKTLATVAQFAADSGALDQAERIAQSIADPVRRARALGSVARAYAGDGDLQRATDVAVSIADPAECAKTLTALAIDFDPDRSKMLLAQALSIGHWSICLPALVRIEPKVITAVGEEFLHAHNQEERPLGAAGLSGGPPGDR
ncbi:hypothetical protein J7E88_17925 [Streptomyces sp. ISL-10]|uniref:hypothetical protein n=1 Tax=Streptomyces sp. ISL-10 TaxID=2819172 RepID=UPI001BEBA49D|nr:hypothetical protein [Streptomyces sp. ISL-10]MBT2367134.1 hypothetical protein [Streptomyces sp. ISL-10]